MTAPPDADPPDADPQTPAPGDASIDWPFVLDDVPKHPRPFVAPDPVPGAPFLFTVAGMADDAADQLPPLPPLSDEAKAALRQEVGLADEYANMVGREICGLLLRHRLNVQAAISQYVEPQIEAMLAELSEALDSPFDPEEP